jgi:tetratricopeptide (TPR) repeat protein
MHKSFLKKLSLLMLTLILTTGLLGVPAHADKASIYKTTEVVNVSGGTRTLSVLWADLKDEYVRLDLSVPESGIGTVDSLQNLYESTADVDGEPVGAINGSFFNADYDLQPLGNLIQDGQIIHGNTSGTTIAIEEGGLVHFDSLFTKFSGGINGQTDWPYNWYAWNINHVYHTEDAVMIFDYRFGGDLGEHDYTVITVDKKEVVQIQVGGFDIPEEGYLIVTKDSNIIDKFALGDQVSVSFDAYIRENGLASDETYDYDNVRTGLGAGPLLINYGEIVLDAQGEGFTEDKIVSGSATRSLIGVTKEQVLAMTVVPNVTMEELAEIALELGLYHAMNLDGGGSSGMIYEDKYVYTPGRDLSNALVIRHLYERPIKIKLNGDYLYFDTEPYLNEEFDRAMVPLRGIAEALDATVGWDATDSSITIQRYDTVLKCQIDSQILYVNGEKKIMDVPVVLRDSRSYVPVRFITEYFGGFVDWENDTWTVILEVDRVEELLEIARGLEENGQLDEAANAYQDVLTVDENNVEAIKSLATLYSQSLNNPALATEYYLLAVELEPEDTALINSLAWLLYNQYEYTEAIKWFKAIIELEPNVGGAYYGVGVCYSSYTLQEVELAKTYFELALEHGLTGAAYDYATEYINTH